MLLKSLGTIEFLLYLLLTILWHWLSVAGQKLLGVLRWLVGFGRDLAEGLYGDFPEESDFEF